MRFVFVYSAIPFVFLTACSSGSDNMNGGNQPVPEPSLGIDASNGSLVAGAAYGAAITSGDLAQLSGSAGIAGIDGGGNTKPAIQGQVKGVIGPIVQQIPIGSGPQDCLVDGSVDISGNIKDPIATANGALTPGDSFRVEYSACDDGTGEILDGRIDMVVGNPFNGDIISGAYEMIMDMTITNFQVTAGTDVILSHGDTSATLNTMLAPYVEASVGGGSITVTTNTASETLMAYSSAQTLDGRVAPAPFTMTASGTLDSSQLGGIVSYSTPVTFTGLDTGYPTAGELLVEGLGSSARLIAQANGTDVVIELDVNDDGVVDETINTTWLELASL